eukprot:CAMPEP_0181093016 /NCGR_PEP_ID=MMETSP1071-20121207/9223_1 /TAXON_ID=35127 /ORGANISM="Thalassiosira sp., Strain NH16" /LENGTH=111 /DNA_ID=CAMNT_0023175227 /DNA_START=283 /DNA_END=618 /DNA_ORIENTATION=-
MIRSFAFIAAICFFACLANAFQAPATSRAHVTSDTRGSTNLQMIFGPPKDDGKPGDYLCKDCGWVFTKGPEAWSKLPDKGACPPCGSPKFRFKKIPKGSADGKVEVKKSWF